MQARTRSERRAYEAARQAGTLGRQVVYGSRPATEAQMQTIRRLLGPAGYRFETDAIKAVLGKNPIGGLNRERASMVIDHLLARIRERRAC